MAAKSLGNTGILFTDRRDFYIKPQVTAELWPQVTPFLTDLMSSSAMKVQDPDFKLFEHRSGFIKQQFAVNDASISSNYDTFVPGDLATVAAIDGITGLASSADNSYVGLEVEVWDSALKTYKGVSLIRGVSSGAVTLMSLGNPRSTTNVHAALADNDVCIVIAPASGEGTVAREAFSDDLEVVYNSTQIFKTPVEVTGTLYEAALRGYSNELARLRNEKSKEHKMQMSKKYLYGVRPYGSGMSSLAGTDYSSLDSFSNVLLDADGNKIRMTMGLIPAIYKYGSSTGDSQNIFTVAKNSYTYGDFTRDAEKVFQYLPTSGVKRAACGQGALSYWSILSGGEGFMKTNKWKVELGPWTQDSLGFDIRTLVTPHGRVELFYDPALRGQYANSMVIYDPEHLQRVVYREAKYQTNIKTDNAYDGIKDQFMNDEGLGIELIEAHSIWNFV